MTADELRRQYEQGELIAVYRAGKRDLRFFRKLEYWEWVFNGFRRWKLVATVKRSDEHWARLSDIAEAARKGRTTTEVAQAERKARDQRRRGLCPESE